MSVAIIDCGSGNLRSAAKAFEKMATKTTGPVYVTRCPDVVAKANFIVLPGQGAFPNVKKGLDSIPGLRESLKEQVVDCGKPFLGICVGMQLMADVSHEYMPTDGLGWLPGEVSKIDPNRYLKNEDKPFKVPHMGWNMVNFLTSEFEDCSGHFYFANSYHAPIDTYSLGYSEYGERFSAFVKQNNFYGVQFHPEKSSKLGEKFLTKFFEMA